MLLSNMAAVLSTTYSRRHIHFALLCLRFEPFIAKWQEKEQNTTLNSNSSISIHTNANFNQASQSHLECERVIHAQGPMPFILLAIGIGHVQVNEWASVVKILKQHQQTLPCIHPFTHNAINKCLFKYLAKAEAPPTPLSAYSLLFYRRFTTHICLKIHTSKWNGSRVEHTPHMLHSFAYCFRRKNARGSKRVRHCVERSKSKEK